MSRRSGTCLRLCLVTFAVISALAVCGPALYWGFKKTLKLGPSKSSCPPCICDCPPPLSLVNIAPGIPIREIASLDLLLLLILLSELWSPEKGRTCYIYINDIMASLGFGQYYLSCRNLQLVDFLILWLTNLSIANDPDLKQEMEKQFLDLLTEELKLQETVAEEHSRHMNITFGEAKRVASQYQKEAEKCIAAIETCEEARERAEASLIRESKVTTVWEQRARQMGWEGE
ncbi:hypothetical protein GOBAR_AA12052 [Gossypium barbadense]|uniref:Uncharacterized protein n=1 Tax=Gossypium barbadense TaxID=3634 RepID=A0A2P5XZ14_GOSBA|nr:hypothetical protein GOBAR_AA12052 [Gossypium barbadense]